MLSFHVIAAVAFAAQLVKTETGVDVGLIDAAVDVLVANHQNDEPNVRIICLQVRNNHTSGCHKRSPNEKRP